MEKIIVSIKGVPKPGTVKVDPETHTLKREDMELVLNPYDRYALEMAVSLKERYQTEVTVISMGPLNVIPVLKQAYSLGADKLILISDKLFAGSDTLATSYVLAKAIEKLSPFSLILMGVKSMDSETSQVGPETASILNLPSITLVKKIYKEEENWIVIRDTDYGEEELEVEGPFLATVSPNLDYLRPPSLKRILKVKNIQPLLWSAKDLKVEEERVGLKGSPTQVVGVEEKKIEAKGVIIEDEPSVLVEKLLEVLKKKEIIKDLNLK